MKKHGKRDAWYELVKDIRKTAQTQARIVLAAAYASVLVEKLNALPFIVHAWGSQSGTGKSVLLQLAASVWADPFIGHYIKSSNSTDVGREVMCGFCNNLPFIMDEIQLIQQMQNFDRMIYTLCEGTGRVRGSRSGGTQETLTWLNTILTSGEQPISNDNSRAGAMNRLIELKCEGNIFKDARDVSQRLQKDYGFSGREFVENLMTDGAIDHVRELQKSFYAEIQKTDVTEKQKLSASVLLAADAAIEEWLFQDGIRLNVNDLMPFLLTNTMIDVNLRALEWFYDWVATNSSNFMAGEHDQYYGRFEDETGRQCSEPNPYAVSVVRSVFMDAMNEAGFNPKAFISWCGQRGAVIHTARMTRVPNASTIRCVVIKLSREEPKKEELTVVQEKLDDLPWEVPNR